jgi:hypothetical protein
MDLLKVRCSSNSTKPTALCLCADWHDILAMSAQTDMTRRSGDVLRLTLHDILAMCSDWHCTTFWRCLLPIGDTKFLSSRLLSDISWGSTIGFRRTAAVSTVRTGNFTDNNKCTLFVLHTHSSQFCCVFWRQLHRHLQGELVCHLHKTRHCYKAG